MTKVPLASLVLDFKLYPRGEVSSQHVHYLVEAMEACAKIPPIVVCKASRRVVDGFHRYRACERKDGAEGTIAIVEKTYKSDAELFVDAMRCNNSHGAALSKFDKTHCVLRAEELGITMDEVASALQVTTEAIGDLKIDRVGRMWSTKQRIPLKRTIRHMAGKPLTTGQQEANDKLSGMNQRFYVEQLVLLLTNDLIDTENEPLMESLKRLHGLLETHVLAMA